MKNFFIAAATLFSLVAMAQQKPVFALQAGATYSNVRGYEGDGGNRYDLNVLAGVSVEFPFNDKTSLVTGVNYERKTFKRKVFIENFDDNFDPIIDVTYHTEVAKVTFQYIVIPVGVRHYIGATKNFYLTGGLYTGIFLDDSYKLDGEELTEYVGESDFKTLDFGAQLGVGMVFPSGSKKFYLELKDSVGLTDISDMDLGGDSIKLNSISLVAGIRL